MNITTPKPYMDAADLANEEAAYASQVPTVQAAKPYMDAADLANEEAAYASQVPTA